VNIVNVSPIDVTVHRAELLLPDGWFRGDVGNGFTLNPDEQHYMWSGVAGMRKREFTKEKMRRIISDAGIKIRVTFTLRMMSAELSTVEIPLHDAPECADDALG